MRQRGNERNWERDRCMERKKLVTGKGGMSWNRRERWKEYVKRTCKWNGERDCQGEKWRISET